MRKLVPYIFALSLFVLSVCKLSAQTTDKKEKYPFVYVCSSVQIPGGDLKDRFGTSFDIGGGLGYKFKSNIILGIESTYIFGNDVKENPLEGLLNQFNQITNMYGEISDITMRQDGLQIKATAGKIFPVFGSNQNSGIYLRGSFGFLQHKIYIENQGNNTPQVLDDYRKGYDRLCNGLMVSEFVGWQNFSSKSAMHFLIGFEISQAWTQNRRSWDFATNQKIDAQRLDLLYTFKIAYYIPFYKREATNYFYY
ncbi:MAG: hypothetical protein JEZ09_12180 [Salinivirgaceae bacterium]|nr:hypothetical protein [Salinivirgaceae bacterium]